MKHKLNLEGSGGHTILEVLMAMVMAITILAPLSLWFYKSKTTEIAYNKYYSNQILKLHLHRAYLEGWSRGKTIKLEFKKNYSVVIEVSEQGNEVKYSGTVLSKNKLVITSLEMSRFNVK